MRNNMLKIVFVNQKKILQRPYVLVLVKRLKILVMSLEIRPLAALYPLHTKNVLNRNAPSGRWGWYAHARASFYCNAARGLITRGIAKI